MGVKCSCHTACSSTICMAMPGVQQRWHLVQGQQMLATIIKIVENKINMLVGKPPKYLFIYLFVPGARFCLFVLFFLKKVEMIIGSVHSNEKQLML